MINYNHSVLSLRVLIIVFTDAVTVGVADGGVADAVNILHPSLHFFLFALLYFFLRRWCVVDIKTQELTTFVFILPGSVCHSSFNIE